MARRYWRRGRPRRPHRAADRPGRRDARGLPAEPHLDLASSTRTRPATSATGRRSCPGCAPAGDPGRQRAAARPRLDPDPADEGPSRWSRSTACAGRRPGGVDDPADRRRAHTGSTALTGSAGRVARSNRATTTALSSRNARQSRNAMCGPIASASAPSANGATAKEIPTANDARAAARSGCPSECARASADPQRVVQGVAEPADEQAGHRQPRHRRRPEQREPGRRHAQGAPAACGSGGTAAAAGPR